jgi:hypothetical protein
MMLSPNNRGVYTDALTPPAGFELDRAIAATFSLDLTTLLSVPLQLVLQATEDRNELMRDPIALYEALQRATERVHVFTQHGRMLAPKREHLLYSLLEPMVTEVVAPRGGAFHPKIWVLRFVSKDLEQTQFRLMLASKNLTADRCWDVALTLDGVTGERENENSATLASFFARLPGLSVGPFGAHESFNSLVDELKGVEWELPDGFEELQFHVLGLDERRWSPAPSRRLVVISPFVRPKALEMLAKTSEIPVAVISRAESFAELDGETPFRDAYVLHDAAETEDGEDETGKGHEIGLHAKAYMYQQGNRTHLAVGSANATDAALIARNNVEILAELVGPSYKVGSVLKFLDEETDSGLRQYLVPWSPDDAVEIDATVRANQRALETARDTILDACLALNCQPDGEHWVLRLSSTKPVDMSALKAVRAWPVTVDSGKAVNASLLSTDTSVAMPVQAMSSLTSLIAFRLEEGAESLSFAVNLPVTGMPEERDRAILRHVVKNRQGFLRYLLMLLAGLGDGADVGSVARAFGSKSAAAAQSAFDDVPLLEELVRAFSRDPKRLRKISRLIDDIRADGKADEILPKGFDEFWTIFREAMAVND